MLHRKPLLLHIHLLSCAFISFPLCIPVTPWGGVSSKPHYDFLVFCFNSCLSLPPEVPKSFSPPALTSPQPSSEQVFIFSNLSSTVSTTIIIISDRLVVLRVGSCFPITPSWGLP
jgi:hypothetical protein